MRPFPLFLLFLLSALVGCSKHNTTRFAPTFYSRWKWAEFDWTFGAGGGIIYPGLGTTVILQFDSTGTTYTIQVNGETAVNGTYSLAIVSSANGPDSSVNVSDPGNKPFPGGGWPLSGIQQLHIYNDTLSLSQIGLTPAGTASDYKFIPYP